MRIFGVQVPGTTEPEPELEGEEPELEGEVGDEEAPDDLADFDDEARAQIEAVIGRREQAARDSVAEHVRQQALSRGFDLGPDGQLLIADPSRVQSWLPQPAAPVVPQPAAVVTPAGPDLSRVPDPTLEPEEHKRWLDAYVGQQLAAQQQAGQEQAKQQQFYIAQLAANQATQRAIQKLSEMGYQQLAQHPEFIGKFQSTLMNLDMQYWQDETNLARIAFGLIPDLPIGAAPVAAAPRKARTPAAANPQQVAASMASRAGSDSFAPSRDSYRAAPADNQSQEALYAKALGIPVEEVRALKDWSGDSYSEYKQKQKAKRR